MKPDTLLPFRPTLPRLAAAILLACLLSACGGDDDEPSSPSTPTEPSHPAPQLRCAP